MTGEITNQDLLDSIHDLAVYCQVRFDAHDERFTQIDQRFDQVDLRLNSLEHQNRSFGIELRELRLQVNDVDGRLMAVENDIKEIYGYLPMPEQ